MQVGESVLLRLARRLGYLSHGEQQSDSFVKALTVAQDLSPWAVRLESRTIGVGITSYLLQYCYSNVRLMPQATRLRP
jgi:hypothetical protein